MSNFTKTDYFCPKCGKKELYDSGHTDDEFTPTHVCKSCGAGFSLNELRDSWIDDLAKELKSKP